MFFQALIVEIVCFFVDTLQIAFDIEVKNINQRGIDSPNNETIIRGPQEAFVENLRTNTSLIRRLLIMRI